MGRKPKKPSPKDLAEIEMLAGMGLTQQQIGHIKGLCTDTLRKYAHRELRRGKSMGIGKVAKTAYEMATSGKHPAMTMFFLKTQAQWRENPPVPVELLQILGLKGRAENGD
jgi:predicted transcriptional regulator